jgi:hypothetical protein
MTRYAAIDKDGLYIGQQIQTTADDSPGVNLSIHPLPPKPDGARFDHEKQQWITQSVAAAPVVAPPSPIILPTPKSV